MIWSIDTSLELIPCPTLISRSKIGMRLQWSHVDHAAAANGREKVVRHQFKLKVVVAMKKARSQLLVSL